MNIEMPTDIAEEVADVQGVYVAEKRSEFVASFVQRMRDAVANESQWNRREVTL